MDYITGLNHNSITNLYRTHIHLLVYIIQCILKYSFYWSSAQNYAYNPSLQFIQVREMDIYTNSVTRTTLFQLYIINNRTT